MLLKLSKISEMMSKTANPAVLRRLQSIRMAAKPQALPGPAMVAPSVKDILSKADELEATLSGTMVPKGLGTSVQKRPTVPEMPARAAAPSKTPFEMDRSVVAPAPQAASAATPRAQARPQPVQPKARKPRPKVQAQPQRQPSRLERIAVPAAVGTVSGLGSAIAADQVKAASLIDSGLRGAAGVARFLVSGPKRRMLTGTTALVGGLGAYGAAKGTSAQHPDGKSPFQEYV